ncbi:hypothetical protein M0R45_033656 [Rubus argutus]|uniref:Uncharacterized protein n=1 Tax=Rubus argutus TaxID=59490 RepID=A0AAW1WKJ8_RUBAR
METKEKRNHQREELDHGIDGKRRVRQRHRYDHHTRRCSKHRRHVKVEDDDDVDIHRDQQPKGRYQSELCKVCRGRVNDASYLGANEIRKRRRKLEELSHDLKEDHNDLPLLLSSSTDSDVVVEWTSIEEIIDLENPYGHEAVEVTYRITLRNPFKRAE